MKATALIFAKYPTPGKVKTRLVPPLTPQQAADLHRAALAATCELVRTVGGLWSVLVVTPDDSEALLARELDTPGHRAGCDNEPEPQASACAAAPDSFRRTMDHDRLVDDHWPQGDGSLGDRLVRAADRAFADGASAVLLFGADSPTMPIAYVNEAMATLERHQAVMGPCDDGGYYLLGLAGPQPALLDRIDWGCDRVAEQTRAQARSAGIDLYELPAWHDIDRWADLPRAAKTLAEYDDLGPQRRALKQEIDKLLRQTQATEHDHG